MKLVLRGLFIIILIISWSIGWFIAGKVSNRKPAEKEVVTVTKHVTDTVFKEVSSIPKGYKLYRITEIDSLKNLQPQLIVKEVPQIVYRDSVVYVRVPISEKIFTGSKNDVDYLITVTGFDVSLNCVEFNYPETTITKTYKKRPLSFAITVGPSVLYDFSKVHYGIAGTFGLSYSF